MRTGIINPRTSLFFCTLELSLYIEDYDSFVFHFLKQNHQNIAQVLRLVCLLCLPGTQRN